MIGLLALPETAPAQQFVTENPDPPTYAEVVVDKLNVRDKGSTDATVLIQLNKGDRVPVKAVKEGWAQLAWSSQKAYVSLQGLRIPEGKPNKKPRYEDMREAFIAHARSLDSTIQWLEVPRQTGIQVRFHWREYKDKQALVARCEELARLYSVMTTGDKGVEVEIVNGNTPWAKAFY
ncbi:MAG: SH3 domain-containing protein [Nitrospirota bacterium]|nr:SH3 domain-containing protein [Nitrospirota bacterium]